MGALLVLGGLIWAVVSLVEYFKKAGKEHRERIRGKVKEDAKNGFPKAKRRAELKARRRRKAEGDSWKPICEHCGEHAVSIKKPHSPGKVAMTCEHCGEIQAVRDEWDFL